METGRRCASCARTIVATGRWRARRLRWRAQTPENPAIPAFQRGWRPPSVANRSWATSAFSHSLGGFDAAPRSDLPFDRGSDIGVDRPPVGQGAFENRRADAAEQTARHLIDQRRALHVIEHLTHKNSGLREIVVLGAQRVSAADHLAVRFPTLRNGA